MKKSQHGSLVQQVAFQLFDFLARLHTAGYIYCDIKTEHVYVRKVKGVQGKWEVKILDSGLLFKYDVDDPPTGLGFTPAYNAPEMVEDILPWGYPAEVFAAGKTILEFAAHDYIHPGTDTETGFPTRQHVRAHGPAWGRQAVGAWIADQLPAVRGKNELCNFLIEVMWPNPEGRLTAK